MTQRANEWREVLAAYAGLRVLVLGASGFIGRWVARRLSESDAELYLAVRDEATASRVFAVYGIHGTIVKLNAADASEVRRTLLEVRPAVTFNMAGYGVKRSERDHNTMRRLNTELAGDLASVMAECRRAGWNGAELVHAGSVAEYGPIGGDLAEESAARPDTPYGRTKLAGSQLLAERCAQSGVRGVTVRLATVYGPGEHPGRLLPSLLEAAKRGESPKLTAGQQRRDFTYVEDVAEGLVRLGTAAPSPGSVVNLATGRLTSVREFSEAAARILGIPNDRLRFGALEARSEEEIYRAPIRTVKLRVLTGWAPSTRIDEGIEKTVQFLDRSF